MTVKASVKKLYLVIFLFFAFLAFFVSLSSGDDFDWGSLAGLERLNNGFANYNGRYLGHLVVLVITRFSIIRIVFYASVNTAIVFLINNLTHSKENRSIYLTLMVLLLIPTNIYAQTFGWYAGFSNYNVGMCLLLLVWVLLFSESHKWYISISLLIVSFMSQLLMENITLFNLISSFVFLILFLRDIPLVKRLCYLIGSGLGAVLMFTNSVYHTISTGADNYRSIDWGNVVTVYFTTFTQFFMINNWLLVCLISGTCYTLLNKANYKSFFQLMLISYPISLLLIKQSQINFYYAPFIVLLLLNIFTMFYLLTIVYIVLSQQKNNFWKKQVVFTGIGSGVILAPFLVIQPFGPRAAFTSYILLTIVFIYLFNHSIETKKMTLPQNIIVPAVCSLSLLLLAIHGSNYYVNQIRVQNKVVNAEEKTITISQVPFGQFEHWINPPGYEFGHDTFKDRYGLPEDYELIFTPFQDSFFKKALP